jgi:phage/plasmid-like protein (TIGR03299 family)
MVAAVTVRKDGRAEMAFVGQTPWHGLGQELAKGADIDTWKESAGMDWSIRRSLVRYATRRGDDPGFVEIPESHVLFRSDSGQNLGIVSNKYKIVQPGEVLEFFRDLTDANGFSLETAGTLFDGRKFWALASINETEAIVGDDAVGGYLLLSSSCDGTTSTVARFTTIRVVCSNTLAMALGGEAKREIVVRHSSRFDATSVKSELGIAKDYFGQFINEARKLATVYIPVSKADDFLAELLIDTNMVSGKDATKSKQFQKIKSLFLKSAVGREMNGADGTLWGLVNATTEFVDHHARSKSDSHRLASAWFGRGDQLKSAAFEKAMSFAG